MSGHLEAVAAIKQQLHEAEEEQKCRQRPQLTQHFQSSLSHAIMNVLTNGELKFFSDECFRRLGQQLINCSHLPGNCQPASQPASLANHPRLLQHSKKRWWSFAVNTDRCWRQLSTWRAWRRKCSSMTDSDCKWPVTNVFCFKSAATQAKHGENRKALAFSNWPNAQAFHGK